MKDQDSITFKARLVNLYGGALSLLLTVSSFFSESILGVILFGFISLLCFLNYKNRYLKISSKGIRFSSLFGKKFDYTWNQVYILYHQPDKVSIFMTYHVPRRLLTIQSTAGVKHEIYATDLQKPYEIEKIVREYQKKYG